VTSLDHYEEDSRDPLASNIAVESGDDIARMVETGSELSAPLQQALVAQAKAAAAERSRFMDSLNREAEELRDAEQAFSPIEDMLGKYQSVNLHTATFGELSDKLETLDELEHQCEAVLSDRQDSCRDHLIDRSTSAEDPSLLDYLYESLEVTYPVLATGTELLKRIETARRGITKSVYSRA
jgi:DNA repair ATPase RecN